MPDKVSSPFGETQERNYKCFYGMMSTRQINSVRSPSVKVFLVTTYNVNTIPQDVIYSIVSQDFK